MATNFCEQCGARLSAGARFCPSCGARVAQAEEPVRYVAAEDVMEDVPGDAPGCGPQADAAVLTGWRSLAVTIARVFLFLPFMDWLARNCYILEGRTNRGLYIKNWFLGLLIGLLYDAIAGAIAFAAGFAVDESVGMTVFNLLRLVAMVPIATAGILLMRSRLHDLGRSGWFMLLLPIPVAGLLLIVYVFCFPGTEGPNAYGSDPLARA